jgi:hypothetical protein
VHNAAVGLFQAPSFSFSQMVMANLAPPGFEFMVRALAEIAIAIDHAFSDLRAGGE